MQCDRAIFLFGFGKNERENIDRREERALKDYAGILLARDAAEAARAVAKGEWIRLRCENG